MGGKTGDNQGASELGGSAKRLLPASSRGGAVELKREIPSINSSGTLRAPRGKKEHQDHQKKAKKKAGKISFGADKD